MILPNPNIDPIQQSKEDTKLITWKNMDTLAAYAELQAADKVCVSCAMSGENGASRV